MFAAFSQRRSSQGVHDICGHAARLRREQLKPDDLGVVAIVAIDRDLDPPIRQGDDKDLRL